MCNIYIENIYITKYYCNRSTSVFVNLEMDKTNKNTRHFSWFTGYRECRHTSSGIQETWGKTKSQCSQKSLTNAGVVTEREKKRIKLKRVGEKSLLRGKSTEELMGKAYNYQGNGDMGRPLTQEKKREMLDLPGKHSWKAKVRLPNRGDISKCVFLSLHHWKAVLKPSNDFPLRYSSQCLILS